MIRGSVPAGVEGGHVVLAACLDVFLLGGLLAVRCVVVEKEEVVILCSVWLSHLHRCGLAREVFWRGKKHQRNMMLVRLRQ